MAKEAEVPTDLSLEEIDDTDLMPTRFSAVGQEFLMGEMTGLLTALPVSDIVGLSVDSVLTRQDYELEGDEPGNRIISPAHVKKIAEGLEKHANKLLTGAFTFALDPQGVEIEQIRKIPASSELHLSKFAVRSGYQIFILDAQHRNRAVRQLWEETIEAVRQGGMEAKEVQQLLKRSSIPTLIILEGDRDEISRMFVTMASTKPISPSLIAVMDREQFANRVGLEVAQKSTLLDGANRLAYQTSTATGENLYAAAAVRGASATIYIGFKDRTPEMREANLRQIFEDQGLDTDGQEAVDAAAGEVAALLDYAYERIPGWRELHRGEIDAKEFRTSYVHGSAAGLYAIAGVLCAARLSSTVESEHVIDLLATEIDWSKETQVEDDDNPESSVLRHPDFEGTLIVNEAQLDENGTIVSWKAKTAGGARTNYEKATRNLLERLAELDDSCTDLKSDAIQVAMGLKSSGKRGRPPKVAQVA
jgi:hypothetical protein